MKQGSGADQGLRLAPDHQRTSVIGDFTLISGVAETLDQFLLYHILRDLFPLRDIPGDLNQIDFIGLPLQTRLFLIDLAEREHESQHAE